MHKLTSDRRTWGRWALVAGVVFGGMRLLTGPFGLLDRLGGCCGVFNIVFHPLVATFMPLAVFLGFLLGARRTEPCARLLAALFFGAAACVFFWFGGVRWSLEDVSSGPSAGHQAINAIDSFFPDMLPIFQIAAGLVTVGVTICWRYAQGDCQEAGASQTRASLMAWGRSGLMAGMLLVSLEVLLFRVWPY